MTHLPPIGSACEPRGKTPAPAPRAPAPRSGAGSGPALAWRELALGAQAKGRLSQPGDAAEVEADRIADAVMRPPTAGPTERPVGAVSAPAGAAAPAEARPDAGSTRPAGALGEGQPLTPDSRAFFEPSLGRDLGQVRIHTDERAQSAARGLNARAFTLGRDVAFAAGEFDPGSQTGRHLLAHELAHVVQQADRGPAVQRQPAPAAAPAATPAPGTLADVTRFATRPGDEPDPTLKAAMGLWGRYSAKVAVAAVDWRLLPASEQESAFGDEHHIGGRSHWEGATPVIEVPQVILDDFAEYLGVRGTPAASLGETDTPSGSEARAAVRFLRAPLERAHEAVRLIGHELYHLWREKEGHSGNPVQAPFEKEAASRMAKVRANWVEWLKDAPAARLRAEGIPSGTVIKTWKDIPKAQQTAIEEGAAKTDYISGLYQRSAYLVEEIYTKVEELSYLRVQQRDTTPSVYQPSQSEVSQLATLVYFLNNVLHSAADPDGLVTPALLKQTETAMLEHLRKRFPSTAGNQYDSYEVVFYLCAIRSGQPPHYSDGRLISNVPGARVPP